MQVITRQLGKGDVKWQNIMVKIREARDAKRGVKANGAAVSEARPHAKTGDGREVRSQLPDLPFSADAQPCTNVCGMAVIWPADAHLDPDLWTACSCFTALLPSGCMLWLAGWCTPYH